MFEYLGVDKDLSQDLKAQNWSQTGYFKGKKNLKICLSMYYE